MAVSDSFQFWLAIFAASCIALGSIISGISRLKADTGFVLDLAFLSAFAAAALVVVSAFALIFIFVQPLLYHMAQALLYFVERLPH